MVSFNSNNGLLSKEIQANILLFQVSYFSTSPELSNKQRFEYFTRTIPSDLYQVKAMVDIVKLLKWSYISIIYEESNYGIKVRFCTWNSFSRYDYWTILLQKWVSQKQSPFLFLKRKGRLNKSNEIVGRMFAFHNICSQVFSTEIKFLLRDFRHVNSINEARTADIFQALPIDIQFTALTDSEYSFAFICNRESFC